jgi:hypothetical protein
VSTDYIYDTWLITSEFDDYNNIKGNYGFWFFDYEKALRTNSILASCYDISAVENIFGIRIPYLAFSIDLAYIDRYYDLETEVMAYIFSFGGSTADWQCPYTGQTGWYNPSGDGDFMVYDAETVEDTASSFLGLSAHSTTGSVGFSSLAPALIIRNFIPYQAEPLSEEIDDYRLLMFEFATPLKD